MEAAGIVDEHNGITPWIHNGAIHITIDMREANKAILSTNIPTPRAEDMQAFSAAKLFQ